jgi:hypothetical protein
LKSFSSNELKGVRGDLNICQYYSKRTIRLGFLTKSANEFLLYLL